MHRGFPFVRAMALGLALGLSVATPALAHDLTLGVHYTSEDDKTDTVYVSLDGETFYGVSQPYVDLDPYTEPAILYHDNHSCHMDPGITYWNGKFWMVSAEQRWDGRMWPIVSYSTDLVHWTHPENNALLTSDSTRGIALDVLPTVGGRAYANFDVVTPKFQVIDGELYLTFCAGYFGLFHGNQFHDEMSCYVAKVQDMSADDPVRADGEWYWPENQRFVCEQAHLVTATDYDGSDYIDSNFVTDTDGTSYLIVKQGGLTEQMFRCDGSDPSDGTAYTLVNDHVSWGYEGVSINYANGLWHLYGDGVIGTKARGMREVTSASLLTSGTWTDDASTDDDALHDVTFVSPDGRELTAMHGQEITISPDSEAYAVCKAALAASHPEVAAELDVMERDEAAAQEVASSQEPVTSDETERDETIVTNEPSAERPAHALPVNVTYETRLTHDASPERTEGNLTFSVCVS